MKSLLNINLSVLHDYDDWKNSNPNWNIADYLHLNFDLNTAISFSKLFFPDFVEKEGCAILVLRYDEAVFWQWHEKFKGNIQKIEYKCNFYEVMDFFNTNCDDYENDELYQLAISEFAKSLKKSWEINLKILFPDKKMVVEVFDEYDSTRITIYSIN